MRRRGLEPPQDFSHNHLKVACLPFHHLRKKKISGSGKFTDNPIFRQDRKSYESKETASCKAVETFFRLEIQSGLQTTIKL